jgi:ribosomal subunit interface protein
MKINLSADKDIFLTTKQQQYIQKRLSKLDRFVKDRSEAVMADINLTDETGTTKGGVGKMVNITIQIPGEQAPLHIKEREDKIMRAFNMAIVKVERRMRDEHQKLVKANKTSGRLDKVFGFFKRG